MVVKFLFNIFFYESILFSLVKKPSITVPVSKILYYAKVKVKVNKVIEFRRVR